MRAALLARRREERVLDGLTAQESQTVLRLLLKRHLALLEEAEGLAAEVASSVDREAVAEDLVAVVRLMSLEELDGRSGRQPWGYVEPWEAAWELLEEAVKGYRDDIVRLAALGLVGIEGVRTRVTTPARSVADAFEFRSRVGLELALGSLKSALRERAATPAELDRVARVCREQAVMRPCLEALT